MLPEPAGAFGRCRCGGRFDRRAVEVTVRAHHPPTVLPVVPQGVCSSCSAGVYQAGILEIIEQVFRRPSGDQPPVA